MTFIHFGMRMKIEKLFLEWCEENQIAKLPNSMIVFMLEKDWLNKKKIVEDLAEQIDIIHANDSNRLIVCPNCGRTDYIRSFDKDFNIKNSGYRFKCINCNTYIK